MNYDRIKTEGPNDDLKSSFHASDFFDSDPDCSTSGGLAASAYELVKSSDLSSDDSGSPLSLKTEISSSEDDSDGACWKLDSSSSRREQPVFSDLHQDDLIPNTIEEQDAYINETSHRFLYPAQGFCIDHIQDDSNHEGESAVDKVPTNYKQSLSTSSSGSNIKMTSSSSSTGYSFPIVPHPAPHINRPTSTMTTSSSSRSIAVSIPHRPQSVATTSSTNSGRVKAAVSSNALSLAAPSPHSLKPPRLRTKSLKHTSSDPKIGDDHRPQSQLQHQASSSRVQSPSFGARGGGTREQSVCLN
ncbi:hypothetical protein BY996DRAFT_6414832 [Phakopsora pachyrhizi]|nr:hypothetical protein BY996DRAFT_8521121 [Phakopsora pachyrhizi]KAI8453229.1 hypothetical protein BY996DRAFT_6414832 [Phakopsora pachyrhizi]